jgi:hypothetical protein
LETLIEIFYRRSFMLKLRASTVNRVASLPSAAPGAPVLEPTTQHFIDALAAACGPPLYTLTPQVARKVLSDAQAAADRRLTVRELLLKISAAEIDAEPEAASTGFLSES